jgi:hypothetical protein
MPVENSAQESAALWVRILRDTHFWIPVIVLFVGLVVLHWIR